MLEWPKRIQNFALVCGMILSVGCASKPSTIFNPNAVYMFPPEGLIVSDLIDVKTQERTGRVYVPAGTMVLYDAESIGE